MAVGGLVPCPGCNLEPQATCRPRPITTLPYHLKETDIFENQSWCCGASGVGVDNGNEQEHSLYGHVARVILALTTFSMHCHGMHVVFEFWQCSPVSFVSV